MRSDIQTLIASLFKNRVDFFRQVEALEKATGRPIDAGDIQAYIDYEFAGKEDASVDDANSMLSFINHE